MQQRYYDPGIGRFLSVDPVTASTTNGWNFNRYNYAANNPYKFTDPDGRIIESPWDAANVAMGAVSFAKNMATGNYVGAAVDAVGVVIDAAATATPGVPGGAGAAIKAIRGADAAIGAARGAGSAADGAKGADFVVTSKGEAIPVPNGASGPAATLNKNGKEVGFEFTGGSGGKGRDKRVDGVRVMDGNQHQGPRAVYMNQGRQTVDPSTGKTVGNDHPKAHHYLERKK